MFHGEQREPAASAAYKRFAQRNLGEGGFTSPEQNEIRGHHETMFHGEQREPAASAAYKRFAQRNLGEGGFTPPEQNKIPGSP